MSPSPGFDHSSTDICFQPASHLPVPLEKHQHMTSGARVPCELGNLMVKWLLLILAYTTVDGS